MGCRLFAAAVLWLHLAFILFAAAGVLLVWRWRRLAWLQLPAAAWAAYVEIAGRICPLTPLENWLRRMGGAAGYDAGFVEHYLLAVIYPAGLGRDLQWLLGLALLAANLAAYAGLWLALKR